MAFNTIEFFIFLTAFILLYYLLPVKLRNPLLLLGSYLFYAFYSPALTIFLVAITLVNFIIALVMEQCDDNQKARKKWLVIGLILDIGVLAFYKYFNFFSLTIHQILRRGGSAATMRFLVPLGISFITFSVASYLVDVYRKTISAEQQLFRFALYVAFFPKVVQGPIERAGSFLPQLDEEHRFNDRDYRVGLLMILFGTFMKMVVADRAGMIVDTIYGDLGSYCGAAVAFAACLFSLQIYFDFAGYSLIAIGAGRMLGFRLMDNFKQPYLAPSPAVFWRRWHISLTSWLRDYLYFPLGGSRCSRARKWFNMLVTFGLSGLWHGADWGFVAWGLINGAFVATENDIRKSKKKRLEAKGKPTDKKPGFLRTVLMTIFSFILMTFTWVFFRAQKLSIAVSVLKRIVLRFHPMNMINSITKAFAKGVGAKLYGLDLFWGYSVLIAGILIIFVVDLILQKRSIAEGLAEDKKTFVRWLVYIFLIMAIIIFGVYGYGYEAANFIYADF